MLEVIGDIFLSCLPMFAALLMIAGMTWIEKRGRRPYDE